MDPISQGVLGATVPQSVVKDKGQMLPAFIIGWLAGMAADLDILIQSASDPLLSLEYHRHFTHSLSFIPIGALICAVILLPFLKRKFPLKQFISLAFSVTRPMRYWMPARLTAHNYFGLFPT